MPPRDPGDHDFGRRNRGRIHQQGEWNRTILFQRDWVKSIEGDHEVESQQTFDIVAVLAFIGVILLVSTVAHVFPSLARSKRWILEIERLGEVRGARPENASIIHLTEKDFEQNPARFRDPGRQPRSELVSGDTLSRQANDRSAPVTYVERLLSSFVRCRGEANIEWGAYYYFLTLIPYINQNRCYRMEEDKNPKSGTSSKLQESFRGLCAVAVVPGHARRRPHRYAYESSAGSRCSTSGESGVGESMIVPDRAGLRTARRSHPGGERNPSAWAWGYRDQRVIGGTKVSYRESKALHDAYGPQGERGLYPLMEYEGAYYVVLTTWP